MTKHNENFIDSLAKDINASPDVSDHEKTIILQNLQKLKKTKVNILITGATGCGKSSTINALFEGEVARVGQGSDPETMDIKKFELNNIILWDSPGLGDGKDADRRHAKNIIDKLYEKDVNNNMLIDLVLVILDGSHRDLGTSYQLINEVILPNIGEDKSRLLVAINQADVAMKGRYWDYKNCKPEPELERFLNEKVDSTKRRVKEATGVDVDVIYYAAGFKDGEEEQQPYNLSKLLYFILSHTKPAKRAVFTADINRNKKMWEKDDELEDYRGKIKTSLMESIVSGVGKGADIGGKIGSIFGKPGEALGKIGGAIIGGAVGFIGGLFGW